MHLYVSLRDQKDVHYPSITLKAHEQCTITMLPASTTDAHAVEANKYKITLRIAFKAASTTGSITQVEKFNARHVHNTVLQLRLAIAVSSTSRQGPIVHKFDSELAKSITGWLQHCVGLSKFHKCSPCQQSAVRIAIDWLHQVLGLH